MSSVCMELKYLMTLKRKSIFQISGITVLDFTFTLLKRLFLYSIKDGTMMYVPGLKLNM